MKLLERVKEIGDRRRELGRRVRGSDLPGKAKGDLLFLLRVAGWLARLAERSGVAVERMQRLFASKSESSAKILRAIEREAEAREVAAAQTAAADGSTSAIGVSAEGADDSVIPIRRQKRKKGHGRRGAKGYAAAREICVEHESLRPGDRCPGCGRGKLYWSRAGRFLKLLGRSVIESVVYVQKKLRCNACGAIFSAKLPPGVGDGPVATASACAMVAVLRYGYGFPHYRLGRMQTALGTPLSPSTQWEMAQRAAGPPAQAVYTALRRRAAQGEILHTDDTTAKVLELAEEISGEQEAARAAGKKRADHPDGLHNKVYTSGILSKAGGRKILLLFTGRRHAGDNLDALLTEREASRGPPIQMSDMLSSNRPKKAKTDPGACLGHGRRGFVDCFKTFAQLCTHAILELREVFKNDAVAKTLEMTDDERLLHHQLLSGPVMERLRTWFERQFDEKQVEPNSPLGQAMDYMLRHWQELTLFLRVPGAPLTNDDLEREFKPPQSHLKNSLFYLTTRGAAVGDRLMSLIQTSVLNDENPFEYLVALDEHEREVLAAPENWLPWNWRETLAAAQTKSASA